MLDLKRSNIKKELGKSRLGKHILKALLIFQKPAFELRTAYRRLLGKIDMLYLDVTHACNLRCITCYTRAGSKKSDELTLEEKKSVIRQAKEMGAKFISLSGSGEPLLYKDIFDLIDYIRQLKMGVTMFTNGILLNKEKAELLLSKNVEVLYKLYSLDPDIFDRMTGVKGSYEWVDYSYVYNGKTRSTRIPSALKHLLDARPIDTNDNTVKIEAVITKINYSTLPDVARFCMEMGLPLFLEVPVFKGRAIENYKEIALNNNEYRDLHHTLLDILGEEYFWGYRNNSCLVERNPVVWTNGDVGFCSSRKASIGNVRNESLRSLFSRVRQLKSKEDRLIAKQKAGNSFFRTCRARQFYESKYKLPCNH